MVPIRWPAALRHRLRLNNQLFLNPRIAIGQCAGLLCLAPCEVIPAQAEIHQTAFVMVDK